ncbi:MAG TPA: hypothetical protein DCR55_17255 [Lentisphaeria bacterium]|nr:hypothetical protein [Lentisphaeria bacterium]
MFQSQRNRKGPFLGGSIHPTGKKGVATVDSSYVAWNSWQAKEVGYKFCCAPVKLALFDLTGTGNIVVPNAEGNAKREFLIHVVAKRRGE